MSRIVPSPDQAIGLHEYSPAKGIALASVQGLGNRVGTDCAMVGTDAVSALHGQSVPAFVLRIDTVLDLTLTIALIR